MREGAKESEWERKRFKLYECNFDKISVPQKSASDI